MSAEIHPSLLKRKILHVDMDAFYAAVEVRANPDIAQRPIIVGGSPQGRGVVCTANYIARRYGIKSAMPSAHAYRLCPEALFIRPNFKLYKEASQEVFAIFEEYTDKIQGLSLDEAFLDVSERCKSQTATSIARELKDRIVSQTKLTASIGVAPNKMLAKISSDLNKPNGITVVVPQQAFEFMQALPVRKIPGIGPVTAKRLEALGVVYCRDVLSKRLELIDRAPDMFPWLVERCHGLDDREVDGDHVRKSVGVEETFDRDFEAEDDLLRELRAIVDDLSRRLHRVNVTSNRFTLKVKYSDFITRTHAATLPVHTRCPELLFEMLAKLLLENRLKHKKIRLIGAQAVNLNFLGVGEAYVEQPSFRW